MLENVEWFYFLLVSVAQERSPKRQTALEFELGTTPTQAHIYLFLFAALLWCPLGYFLMLCLLKVFRKPKEESNAKIREICETDCHV